MFSTRLCKIANVDVCKLALHCIIVVYANDLILTIFVKFTRAHHRDEKPERDLTYRYHLTCLLIYHGTTTHL